MERIDKRDIINLLTRLIGIKSVYTQEEEIAQFIASYLENRGFKPKLIEVEGCGPNVVARVGKGKIKLIFNGHMDTIGICQGWTGDPFKARMVNGKVYGLGAADMKGGLTSMLLAAVELADEEEELECTVEFHFVSDEEGYSRGTYKLVEQGLASKGDLAIVCEPTGLDKVVVARRGRLVFEVTILGKSAHGTRPWEGVNAIEEAFKVVRAIKHIPVEERADLATDDEGTVKGSAFVIGVNAVANGLSVPERCTLYIDRHYCPGYKPSWVYKEMEKFLSTCNVRFKLKLAGRPTPYLEAYESPLTSRVVKAILNATREEGVKVKPVCGLSVADDCVLASAGVEVVSYGPGGGNIHGPDEYVLLDQVVKAVNIYVRIPKLVTQV